MFRLTKNQFWVIYLLRSRITQKVYVGQAKNLNDRLRRHEQLLARGKHPNPYLQHTFNLRGLDEFEVEVLEEVRPIRIITEREQFWMDHHRAADPMFGYNANPVAESPPMTGRNHSEEAKAKIRANNPGNKGKPHSEETKAKMRESMKRRWADPEFKASQCLAFKVPKPNARGKKRPYRPNPSVSARFSKTALLTSPSGEIVRVENLAAFCRQHLLTHAAICMVARGKRPHHKGWKGRYVVAD